MIPGRHTRSTLFLLILALGGIPVLWALQPGRASAYPPPIQPSCPNRPADHVPGALCEDFDTDRNGVPGFQWTRIPLGGLPGDPLAAFGDPNDDVLGYVQGTGPSPQGTASVVCAHDATPPRPFCSPVWEENDWHLHSPYEGPGTVYDFPRNRPGIGAPDGGKAHSGFRSMHMGRHLDPTTTHRDTFRFRQVAAFVLDPEVVPGPGSSLEFWQIARFVNDENAGAGFLPPGTSFGGGQVQISLLGAAGYERWRTLSPGFNGYTTIAQTHVGICEFDPGDDLAPPADETFCAPSPYWDEMGDVFGTDATCQTDTDGNDAAHKDCGKVSSCPGGPGCAEVGSIGPGVWVRSTFDLSPFAGRQARLRWIGMMGGGWSFGTSRSFLENQTLAYQYWEADDGWWIDDIHLTDLRQNCANADGDELFVCGGDCDDTDPAAWSTPTEVESLAYAADGVTLQWGAPADPGGLAPAYDLLRSPLRWTFVDLTDCVLTDAAAMSYQDPDLPPIEGTYYYLVRATSPCPGTAGEGPLGANSDGMSIPGRSCP